jgi:uncharacterized cupin superfamily protein
MSELKLPALDPETVPERRGSIYPEPYRSLMGDRAKRRLGEACGLTKFGVNLVTLGPGGQSAPRHWHTLQGVVRLPALRRSPAQTPAAEPCGRAVRGLPRGGADAHHFVNAATPGGLLEIGNARGRQRLLSR